MPDVLSKVNELSDKQAVRALALLYDLAPAQAWEGGTRPTAARIEKIMERVRDQTPEEAQSLIDGIFPSAAVDQRGVLARYILEQYAASDELAPTVERAADLAAKPDMALDPVTLTAIAGFMILASPVIKTKNGSYKGGLVATIEALHVDKIVSQLPAILKAIPESILDHFMRRF